MFNSIGEKLKKLAYIVLGGGVVASLVFLVLALCWSEEEDMLILFLSICGGVLISALISAYFIYGFGQLVDNSDKLVSAICKDDGVKQNKNVKVKHDKNEEVKQGKNEEIKQDIDEKAFGGIVGKCELCEKSDVPVCEVKIVDELGTRYRKICIECFKRNNATKE